MKLKWSFFSHSSLLIALSCLLFACQDTEEVPEPEIVEPDIFVPPTPSLPTKESLLSIDIVPGNWTGQMPMSENKSWRYNIFVPDSIKENAVPLILALHGGNGDTHSAESFMQCLPLAGLSHMNAIIFAPTGGQWWDELHAKRVVEFVRLAKLHWPIDSNKVAVTGYSNGGTGSVFFAKNHPNSFSAAIPMGADYKEAECPGIPTYMIHGSEDEFYSPPALKRIVDGLIASNCDIQLHLIQGASHGSACQMDLDLRKAGDWLREVVWRD